MGKNIKISRWRNHIEASQSKKIMLCIVLLASILCINLISAATWKDYLNDGLVSYYDFDEGTGSTSSDYIDGNHLSLTGTPSWTTGIINNALRYDGTNYARNSSSAGIPTGNTNVTMSFWINFTSIGGAGEALFLASLGNECTDGKGFTFLRVVDTNKLSLSFVGASYEISETWVPVANKWYHIVGIHSGNGVLSLYVNGTLLKTEAVLAPNMAGSQISIANSVYDPCGAITKPSAVIDEVAIWNRSLNSTEVSNLYNNGNAISPTSLSKISIDLIYPEDGVSLSTVGENFSVNYTATNYNLTNATYYLWNSTGLFNNSVVVDITGTSNSTNESIDDFILGDYEWNVYTCYENSTFSNCSFADKNYSFFVGASVSDESYNSITYETSSETFIANISLISGASLYDAQLIYNETAYDGKIVDYGGANYSLIKSLDIPLITTPSSSNWYWRLTYEKTDGSFTYQNLSTHNQSILGISLYTSGCVSGENLTLNFSSYDEEDLSAISNFSFYATFEYWLGSGSVKKNISISNPSVEDNMFLCISPDNLTYYSDAKIQYEKPNYIKRSYYLINSSLTNTTNNIGLYLINSSVSTSFIINVIDNVQFPVTDAYVYIQRYYPGSGIFHTVEMAKTDTSGNTIGHFEAETEDYKVIIFKDGEILYESKMQKVFCGETPCTLKYQIQAAAPTIWEDIGDIANLIWYLTYNEDTKIWTYTYVDTSGTTNWGRLLVYTEDGLGKNIICNVTDTSSAATLTCNVTGYEGTVYAQAFISRSPEIPVWLTSIINKTVKIIFGIEGLFWATFILLVIGLVGIWNPSIGIIMMIGGIIAINFLQIASLGTVTIMGISIIGLILLWEMKKP